jgi:type II restriction enzyme
LGSIGASKNFDVWIPPHDRPFLDWSLTDVFDVSQTLPPGYENVKAILHEIDVVWIRRGTAGLAAVYEVEHSTPIYSGLLRLNDVRLANPAIDRLTIVSDEPRRAAFVRQLNRPTFTSSGLTSVCSFLDYADVYDWHRRLVRH